MPSQRHNMGWVPHTCVDGTVRASPFWRVNSAQKGFKGFQKLEWCRGARMVINAGAGGVDAMDWAEMLERMYGRWAQSMGYATRTVDRAAGEEAGVKSVELEFEGPFA